ncbi:MULTISPECIES: hypothetical protein [unclassified Sphingomonas]|uniref:hypothetical protein n=1 Tax=unclassified Sphingomonas TaxID=196159 RepID=UPI0006F8175B|nr:MULTISPECIES: hypothetical protein [unclassified Sphingomonas]KQN20816.1 hypothetical protein ASE89_15155 [Sphingomonas sp. Leaf30]MBD8550295.1 hypothetical protein [Sphingomonas sp. CFBP 8764]
MNPTPVDLSRLNDPRVIDHIEKVDSRIRGGFRLCLDVLGIELPDYAKCKPAGRPSIAKLMAAADADSGTIHTYRAEKLRVGPFAPRP